MSETHKYSKNILNRAHRVHGQIEALERAIMEEQERSSVLQLLAATRGAMNGLMAEIMHGMLNDKVLNNGCDPTPEQQATLEEIMRLIRTYLK